MSEPVTIDPNPPANPGLDFYHLKREGTRLVQELSGDIWTDYNEHDPGVTTLEQLCYALTELSYRAQFSVADFLTERKTGQIDAERQALYPPAVILPCNPVTIDDYRKLIVDRVPEVANVWLRPRPYGEPGEIGGLYEIGAYAPGLDPRCIVDVTEQVREVYAAHRDLCEDASGVIVLRPLKVEVFADVSVDETRSPESILADLYFELGNTLAPEPRRRSLDDLIARGDPPEAIFNGPLVVHGFIDDNQLRPKAETFTARELARVMQGVAGVTGVRNVEIVAAGSRLPCPPGGECRCLEVDPGQIPELEIHPPRCDDRDFTLRLSKNGIPLCPKSRRVERELERRWARYRRTYPLWPQYEEAFAMPQGHYRDLRAYESIQNQYPNVYGINSFGLPESARAPRQAQARQLKGYLLAFEQQLADFFAQLSRTKDLFSVDECLDRTYFFQLLSKSVPDVEPLLRRRGDGEPGYAEGLDALVRSQDPYVERRNRFLDVLLSLYGERLRPSDVVDGSDEVTASRAPGEHRISAKIALLRGLVEASTGRDRGFDKLGPLDESNHAGMQVKCRVQLGFPALDQPPLTDVLDELGIELAPDGDRGCLGRRLGRRASDVEAYCVPVPPELGFPEEGPCDSDSGPEIVLLEDGTDPCCCPPYCPPLSGRRVCVELVRAAADRANLWTGSLPGENTTALVCRCGSNDDDGLEGDWRLLDKCESPTRAWFAACAWERVMQRLTNSFRQLYLVEHVLLRYARRGDRNVEVPFDYSFTLSAVLSGPPGTVDDPAWRDFAREVLRDNTPAHLALNVVFLDPLDMVVFEGLYWDWRRALRQAGDTPAKAETSARLRDFLIAHHGGER